MKIKPKIWGNTCVTAHPEGCALSVSKQIEYIRQRGIDNGFKRVLVIGSSTGYGLASRITAAFGSGAATIGIAYEKAPSAHFTGTAGFYNTEAFDREAQKAGLTSVSLNGDAFSMEMKEKAAEVIRSEIGDVDLVIYSLASGRRKDPETGEEYRSAIKPIGEAFSVRGLDLATGTITQQVVPPATPEEIQGTVKVMGGEDWEQWINFLKKENLLADGAMTVAYSYIGSSLTQALYRNGTLGKAKEHLENTAEKLNDQLSSINGKALVSVNKAIVTRASVVIPNISIYIAALFQVMKKKGLHEGAIEQMCRLFNDYLTKGHFPVDEHNRLRLDDWELRQDVQEEVLAIWKRVTPENVEELTDLRGFREDFYNFFGFDFDEVDYEKNVELQKSKIA
jgi:enoyl-[acyl-carrier protein] reductase/trans-2-enoyl-CoA reductase (NAD+)